ncbi:MAG: ABC transporter permease [Clostridia bacterium]|nr:ABC transporter permease [Clostridia bacterium]
MTIFLGLAETVLREGFVYSLMAMGVYITYKILDFPDLSVDGTFPLGACVTAALITAGVNPWFALLISFFAGALAGSLTGLLHVKLRITDLLSGILVMTAMWSVNLIITGKSAILQFFNKPTIFNYGLIKLLPKGLYQHRHVLVVFLLAVALKLLLDWFLSTKQGLLLRAAGDNSQYVISLAKDPGTAKILGLALGNGCTALAGSVLAQLGENADVNAGKGMVVMALAAVIIGTSMFRSARFLKSTTMAVLGAVLYKACLQIALQLGLPTHFLKLLMAVLLTAALLSQRLGGKRGGKAHA